jgi:outer membrane protein TolC
MGAPCSFSFSIFSKFVMSSEFNNQFSKYRLLTAVHAILWFGVVSIFPLYAEELSYERACEQAMEQQKFSEYSRNLQSLGEARLEQASSLPNPSVFYEEESARGSGDFDESSIGVSTRLDFLWKRGARIQAAREKNQIAEFQMQSRKLALSHEVGGFFVEYAYLKKDLSLLKDSLIQHRRALGISRELLKKGMISSVSLKRIELKIEELELENLDLEAQIAGVVARFSSLVGRDDAIPENNFLLWDTTLNNQEKAVETALEGRPDLKSIEAMSVWAEKEESRVRVESMPEVFLDVSSKKYPGDEKGTFWGVSLELPIGEKRGDSSLAEAEHASSTLAYQWAKLEVEREVRAVWKIWNHLQGDKTSASTKLESDDTKYLRAQQARFETGESTAFEYLDAMGALLAGNRNRLAYLYKINTAYLDLAQSCATELSFHGSNQ